MKRRDFIKSTMSAAAMLRLFPADLSAIARETAGAGLERRELGRTGEKLSILGFGGIVVTNATPAQASARVRAAIDAGVNYFDVAPSYGNAEERLEPALGGRRADIFLACKTQKRTRDEATAELEQSLRRFGGWLDLYQLHAVTRVQDVETILGPNGAMEAFEAARKAGKIRFIGFSAHSVEAALALMKGYSFDTILFPVNYATWHAGNFGPQVLQLAQEQRLGILALKSMAKRPWPDKAGRQKHPKCWYEPFDRAEEAMMALRFTLSHPVTAAIPPGDENLFEMALALAPKFTPLSPGEAEEIKRKALATTPLFRQSKIV